MKAQQQLIKEQLQQDQFRHKFGMLKNCAGCFVSLVGFRLPHPGEGPLPAMNGRSR
jgi:hypothetical protein